MNNKYFSIANKKNIDDKPIRILFKDNWIKFKINDNGWIKHSDGILLCTRCNFEINKKEVKNKKCSKCNVDLQWNLQGQWDFQGLVRSSKKVLENFFIEKDFINLEKDDINLALLFINEDDKEKLIGNNLISLFCEFIIQTEKKFEEIKKIKKNDLFEGLKKYAEVKNEREGWTYDVGSINEKDLSEEIEKRMKKIKEMEKEEKTIHMTKEEER